MNIRACTCKSSSLIEELIPPILYNEENCVPISDKAFDACRYDESFVTPITLTRNEILDTINFLKMTYGKYEDFVNFFEIAFDGKHQQVTEKYLFHGRMGTYKKEFKESKNKRWVCPRNVRWPKTEGKVMTLFNCNLESELKHDKYDVAWCFACDKSEGFYYGCCCCCGRYDTYRICRRARLYIYNPDKQHLRAPIKI